MKIVVKWNGKRLEIGISDDGFSYPRRIGIAERTKLYGPLNIISYDDASSAGERALLEQLAEIVPQLVSLVNGA